MLKWITGRDKVLFATVPLGKKTKFPERVRDDFIFIPRCVMWDADEYCIRYVSKIGTLNVIDLWDFTVIPQNNSSCPFKLHMIAITVILVKLFRLSLMVLVVFGLPKILAKLFLI